MDLRKGKISKVKYKVDFFCIRVLKMINEHKYKVKYRKMLSNYGMDIVVDDGYIDPTAYFDNYDYSRIHIGKNVTISREVLFLLHDWSLKTGFLSLGQTDKFGYFLKDIHVGDNSFIGARVTLLPGCKIGKNCIIGACSVVKGEIPDNSIVVGNPTKVISNTIEWAQKHKKIGDYIEEAD